MKHIKIGVVEDEGITTEIIVRTLGKLNYKVAEPASTYDEAINMLITDRPNLVLIDINLNDKKDGIDLANYIKEHLDIPFIFLTANGDTVTINRAKHSRPLAFLIKPFTQVDLHAAIETALNLHQSDTSSSKEKEQYIFFKVGASIEKFFIPDILFFENNARNFNIHFADDKIIVVRITATELLEKLPENIFTQIQRSYIVNIHKISKIDSTSVYLGEHQLVYKRSMKETLLEKLKDLRR
jgi:DNA-binding LytR/AlgR family response regulator